MEVLGFWNSLVLLANISEQKTEENSTFLKPENSVDKET
jgi:hypothetical protein